MDDVQVNSKIVLEATGYREVFDCKSAQDAHCAVSAIKRKLWSNMKKGACLAFTVAVHPIDENCDHWMDPRQGSVDK